MILFRRNNFHDNIIQFCEGKQTDNSKYLLVMEYADNGTLRNYLKQHFKYLTWNDKFKLALISIFSIKHSEKCVKTTWVACRDCRVIPGCDIYSIDILFWEISGGSPPFCNESCDDSNFTTKILHGLRELPIPDTPVGIGDGNGHGY
ncbi:kinase-like domain-containing protein [Rhizophagus clarus]|uniref:Kinase-like domain-containing protein n=1 Tax=Rhizophagus clarus TaxID=94130 RepID=A0A8H3LUK0_9GLOM|nr:kinase-like domain-containing protein [Rhizophagus clarus]